jgi:import receptor subunit TOM20
MAIRLAADTLDSVYCSKDCQVKAKVQYHNLIFGLEPLLPSEMTSQPSPETMGERRTKQMAFVAHLKQVAKAAPLLIVKFVARQVAVEMANVLPSADPTYSSELPELDSGSYTLYDHIERLRYLEVTVPKDETTLLHDVLKLALPGLEQFLTDERHATLLGKMGYNMYGICFGGGRGDKVTQVVYCLGDY